MQARRSVLGHYAQLNLQVGQGRTHAAGDFTGPKILTQDYKRAIFRREDGAEVVRRVSSVIGVGTAARQLVFEGGVSCAEGTASADAEGFACEALDKLGERLRGRRRNDDATG